MKKRILVLFSVILIIAIVSGCSSNKNAGDVPNDDDKQAQEKSGVNDELIMYTNAEFAPFEYFKGQDIVGVDVDIANEIAKAAGKKLVVKHLDFDSLIPAIVTGKADFVAAGMTITPARQEEVDFSVPYVESIQNIIYKNDSKLENMEDLKGKTIGVQLGTTGDLAVSDAIDKEDGVLNGTGANIKTYANALEASQDLLTGRLDAVVIDKLTAEEIVKNNIDALGTINFGEISESYGIAVKKGNTELLNVINSTLQQLIDENKIEEFINNHTN